VANITVQISNDLILGPWEIINTLSAALFGPIGLLITELGLDSSGYVYLIGGVYPAPQDLFFIIGDFIAHSVSMLVAALRYRYIYKRMRMPRLLAGWVLIVGTYYLMEVPLAVTLFNIAVPDLDASYAVYFINVRLEFVLVAVVTALVLLALPERYRRRQWYESENTPDLRGEISDELAEGTP
jgi:hypothetical protein